MRVMVRGQKSYLVFEIATTKDQILKIQRIEHTINTIAQKLNVKCDLIGELTPSNPELLPEFAYNNGKLCTLIDKAWTPIIN